ncbi:MAG: T9SS type A sorting domain-containing protein [Flavobacteriales bacterium]|nr:T9SS type A sorting domain-containing protein [Flavobacteriales bacterium]MCB9204342.1 T9SS type A sorting domain-containing protein [Flavobacteriales bacterium]
MKKIYLFTLGLLSSVAAIAQPTITEVNMPQIGDAPSRGICSDIPNASTLNAQTGANYSWDFSGLNEVSTAAFSFIEAADSYWPGDFAGSTHCGITPEDDAFTFYSISNASLETDGYRVIVAPGDTVEQDYTDSEVVLSLPATYNSSGTDNFSGPGFAASTNITADGTLSYTCDGYGTLQLPNGTYQNVLRYHANRSETLSVLGFPAGTVTKEQWFWISADYRFWLLLMENTSDPINGVSSTVWYQKTPNAVNPTGIADVAQEDFTVYPNPVAANGTLQLSRALSADESVQLFDTQGRMVKNMNEATSAVSLDCVNAGIYVMKVLNGNGQAISTQKLIVQ